MSISTLLISAFFAQALSQTQSLYSSQNLESFLKVRSELAKVERLEKGCQWEIRQEQFPFHCLSYLQWQLKAPHNIEKLKSQQQKINQICIKTVNQLNSVSRLKNKETLSLVGAPCRKAIKARMLDLEYINRSFLGSDIEIEKPHGTDTGKETNI